MKKGLAALLIAAALAVGLFLPSAVFAVQELHLHHDEEPGIESVDLSAASGLNVTEKLGLFADPNSTLVEIGLGRYQTPDSLSALSWSLISTMSEWGCPVLEAASAVQEQQSAVMITNGEAAFVFWRVLFTDGLGNSVHLYFDDETGSPLGLGYRMGKGKPADLENWSYMLLSLIAEMNGLSVTVETESKEWATREINCTLEGGEGSCEAKIWLEEDFMGVIAAWVG